MKTRLYDETTPAAVALVRIAVGWVFRSEGIEKFLFPAALGGSPDARIARAAPRWPVA